jgi:hypothetical protein
MTSGGSVGVMRRALAGIVGLSPWDARLGHGSFVTVEFGREVALGPKWVRGEWHLWVYGAAWKLLAKDRVIADADGVREDLAVAIPRINGRSVRQINVDDELTVSITFESSFRLTIARGPEPELEDWRFNTPDGLVYLFGPGDRWRSLRHDEPDYGEQG